MNQPLGERYRLGERIAGGGMGSVYRAVDENLGRPVAVKVLRRELGGSAFIVMELVEGETLAERIAATGRTPYAGANPVAIATQHVSAPVPDPRQDLPDLPPPAAALIRRALAKHPADRFASASPMADALTVPGTRELHPPLPAHLGTREPRPPLPGPPVGERSRSARTGDPAVHSPHRTPGSPRRTPGRAGAGRRWRWGRSS
jgi:serine/threonine protein kinase